MPIYSTSSTIQPGEWVSIYGRNLASGTAVWGGDFPTSLGGTSVKINGKDAYLWFVSPGQINLQAPDDTATGSVPVVVTTAGGTASSTVTLSRFAPSFVLLDTTHVTGIILRSNASGAFGGGSYDVIGPTGNSLGYPTVAAKAGDSLVLFAVGFGPTAPAVPAGSAYSGAAQTTSPVSLLINNVSVVPAFAGISSAGLYQINLTLPPGLGVGDLPISASVGGVQTQTGVVISLQDPPATTQLQSLSLSANSVTGGTPVTGSIVLSGPAASGGATISLSSSNASASVPATVTIPAGSASATFNIVTTAVTAAQPLTITASYAGVIKQATLTVIPPAGGPSFSSLVLFASFSPAGYPSGPILALVQPNNGTSTYTASLSTVGLTFVNGVATNQGLSFSFTNLSSGPNLFLYIGATLQVTSASLTFTLSPATNVVLGTSGLSGTLSVTGTPLGGGNAITIAGPLSGYYSVTQ